MAHPVLVVVAVLVVVSAIAMYNRLVGLRVQADNAWSDIDVQLKRRHDLVPNLIEAVKGYAGHERDTLEALVQARGRTLASTGPTARGEAESALGTALHSVLALGEAYPQLRATENFAHLEQALAQVEDAIQGARRYYNAVVRELNTRIETFPSSLIATPFGFTPREFFEVTAPAERELPLVSFKTGT